MNKSETAVARGVAQQLRNQARQAGWASDPVQWASDVLGVHMWSKQREIVNSVVNNKRTVVASCHGTGKALDAATPIPTPGGYANMGDLTPGDTILAANGSPTTILATTGVHLADRYEITLESAAGQEQIICSGNHIWPVISQRDMAHISVRARRAHVPVHTGLWHHKATNITTYQLIQRLKTYEHPSIPAITPRIPQRGVSWETEEWLADLIRFQGHVDHLGRTALTWPSSDRKGPPPEELTFLREWLRERDVQTIVSRRRVRYSSEWTLVIAGTRAIDLLPHLDDQSVAKSSVLKSENLGWRIVRIRALPQGPVQCVQVDSPDSLYLCGTEMVPTHNSMIASVISCWWVSTNPIGDAIVVSTAPTYSQVNKILWEEIRSQHRKAQLAGKPMPGRVTQGDEWKANDGTILAFGRKPPDGDKHAFHGIHRRKVLVVIDEACGVPEEIWTGAEAITTSDACRIIAIGNPDDRNTDFGNAFLKDETARDWNRISVPASSTPNFTGEKVPSLLNEVLVSRSWCEERLRAWGPNDPRYMSKVNATFPTQSQSSLFPPALIATAMDSKQEQKPGGVLRLGVDVARFGSDSNIITSYLGGVAKVEEVWGGTDTVSSAYMVIEVADRIRKEKRCPWVEIRVDAVGLGAGVVDTLNARNALLKDSWFSVFEMHGSASPPTDVGGSIHGYGNARAYWFDQLKLAMGNSSVRLVHDNRVADDLGMIFYHFKHGKIFIMSKEDMKKKFGKSPDFADSLAYATAPVSDMAPSGSSFSQDPQEAMDDFMGEVEDGDLSIAPF